MLDGFTIDFVALATATVIFAIAQSLLAPFVFKMTRKYANAFIGGVGSVRCFVVVAFISFTPARG